MKQSDIDYRPHSRDRKYYLVLPQLRSAVSPDPYGQRLKIKSSFPWEGIAIICVVGAGMYLLLYLGWLDFLIK